MAIGNPPEVIEQAKHTHAVFLRFQEWVIKRKEDEPLELAAEAADGNGRSGSFEFPSFREWMKEQESRPLSISDAQRAELERRSAEDDCFPDDVIPWEQVKADLCSRLR